MSTSPVHASRASGKTCGAKNRQGQPCKQTALFSNGRCRNHGGMSPAGPASATFKHGRYSKFLPANVLAEAEEAINGPGFRSAVMDLAMIDRAIGRAVDDAEKAKTKKARREAEALIVKYSVDRSKVLVDESKRMIDAAEMLTKAQARTFVGAMAQTVRIVVESSSHVTDPKKLMAELVEAWRKTAGPTRAAMLTNGHGSPDPGH